MISGLSGLSGLSGIMGGEFSPKDLTGLKLWLKADLGTGGVSDGDPVTTWLDQSGNGNHATQSTASKKPTYRVNIQNGRPAVLYDGVDDLLVSPYVIQTGSKTMLKVMRFSVLPTAGNYMLSGPDDAGAYCYIGVFNSAGTMKLYGYMGDAATHFETNYSFSTNTPYLFDTRGYTGGNMTAGVNGSDQQTLANASTLAGTNGFGVGALTNQGLGINGYIMEVLYYDRLLTANELADARAYLNQRWGIY